MEVDESDGTIDQFSPTITVALNCDWDHVDRYESRDSFLETLKSLFQNGAGFSNGRLGKALDLSNGGTFVVPESLGPGILGDQARTISLWVKTPRITSYHTPLVTWGSRASNGNLWKVMLDFNDGPNGMLAIGLEGQRKTGGRYPVGDNTWRHLAITLSQKLENSQQVTLFVDGYKEELLSLIHI